MFIYNASKGTGSLYAPAFSFGRVISFQITTNSALLYRYEVADPGQNPQAEMSSIKVTWKRSQEVSGYYWRLVYKPAISALSPQMILRVVKSIKWG